MLSLDKKLYFLHIPKAGGTSIESLYELPRRQTVDLFIKQGFSYKNKRHPAKRSIQHLRLADIEQMFKSINQFKVFTIVRNPYDRFVSEFFYNFAVSKYATQQAQKEIFTAWAKHILTLPPQKLFYINDGHFDTMGNMIHGSAPVYVFKLESIKNLNTFLQCELNDSEFNIPHKRKAERRKKFHIPYREIFTDETQKLFLDVYQCDFDQFGYSTDLFNYSVTENKFIANIK